MLENFSGLSFLVGAGVGAILSLSLMAGVTLGVLALSVANQREES